MEVYCVLGILLSFFTIFNQGYSEKTITQPQAFPKKAIFNLYFTTIQEELDAEEEASHHSDANSESDKEDENSAKEDTDDEENEEISESISIQVI